MEPIMYSSGVPRLLKEDAQASLFDGTPSASDLMGGNSLEVGATGAPSGVPSAASHGTPGVPSTPFDGADDERAPLSMRPKRAGRKLDTKEPQSKRRAQNRAAQRAFRERKERHLQELEMRIAELEQESATWRNSSLMLRSKVTELENELGGGRTPQTAPPHAQHAQHSPGNFQGQSGLGNGLRGPGHQAPQGHQGTQPQQLPPHFPQPNGPIHNGYSSISPQIGPSPPHRNSSVDSLFFDSRSEADTGETPRSSVAGSTSGASGTTPSDRMGTSISSERGGLTPGGLTPTGGPTGGPAGGPSGLTPAQAALGGNPSPNEFCDELSLACVVPKRSGLSTPPVRAPQGAPQRGAQGGAQGDPQAHTQGQNSQTSQGAPQGAPALAPSDQSVIDFSFPNADKEPFDVFQFVNNENSMFDPFDFDAVWETPSHETLMPDIFATQPGQFLGASTGGFGGFGGAGTSAVAGASRPSPDAGANRHSPSSNVPSLSPSTASPVAPRIPSAATTAPRASASAADIIPATTEKYISCTEVWDRICSRPRFGEIDIQGMCSELRAKAKCSDQGVVLPERELEKFLNSYN